MRELGGATHSNEGSHKPTPHKSSPIWRDSSTSRRARFEGGARERAETNGSVTRLRDVARVELGAQDYTQNSYLDNKNAVALGINGQDADNQAGDGLRRGKARFLNPNVQIGVSGRIEPPKDGLAFPDIDAGRAFRPSGNV